MLICVIFANYFYAYLLFCFSLSSYFVGEKNDEISSSGTEDESDMGKTLVLSPFVLNADI